MQVLQNIWDALKTYFTDFYIPRITAIDVFEIIFIVLMFYFVAKTLKNTRSWAVVKGSAAFAVFYLIARVLAMNVITKIIESIFLFLLVVLAIMLAPELRKWIETLANNKIAKRALLIPQKKETSIISEATIREITKACEKMSEKKTGAIIVYENKIPLNDIISTGISMDSETSSQLILNVFEKNTPLHDGAIVISNDRIKAATCYLPVSDDKKISKKYGTRHRAAAGLSETTDAFIIVVSEETGHISVSRDGKITTVSADELASKLYDFRKENTEVKKRSIKNILFGNVALKITSIVVGCVVWFMMVNATNPMTTNTYYDVPVNIINEEYIIEYGKTYSVKSKDKINVTVKGHRNVLDNLLKDDIKIYGDLSKLSEINTTRLYTDKISGVEIILSDEILDIELVNLVSKGYVPTVVKTGDEAEGYYIESIKPVETTFTLSGAEDLIDTIDKVECTIDISNITEDTEISVVPVVYDKNGHIIASNKLRFEKEQVDFNVKVFKTKTVKVNVVIDAGDANQYIESVSAAPNEIYIAAEDEILEGTDVISIKIPMSLSIETLEKDSYIFEIDITDYVAFDIRIPSTNKTENITINFKEEVSKTFVYDFSDIRILNTTDKMTVTSPDNSFSVTVKGSKNTMLSFNEIHPFIDASLLVEGENAINVAYEIIGEVKVTDNPLHTFILDIEHEIPLVDDEYEEEYTDEDEL